MATTNKNLTPAEWVDLGPTPTNLRVMGVPGAMLYVSATAPDQLDMPYVVLEARDGLTPFRAPGFRVWGRTASGITRIAINPETSGGDGSGGGGGGGPTVIGDGDDVALGSTSDAPVTNPAGPGSLIAVLKGLMTLIKASNDKADRLIALNAPFGGADPVLPNVEFTPGRALKVDCAAGGGGKVAVIFADDSTDLIPVVPGLNIIPGAFKKIDGSATTANASYATYY